MSQQVGIGDHATGESDGHARVERQVVRLKQVNQQRTGGFDRLHPGPFRTGNQQVFKVAETVPARLVMIEDGVTWRQRQA
jgi:hypothetical protein